MTPSARCLAPLALSLLAACGDADSPPAARNILVGDQAFVVRTAVAGNSRDEDGTVDPSSLSLAWTDREFASPCDFLTQEIVGSARILAGVIRNRAGGAIVPGTYAITSLLDANSKVTFQLSQDNAAGESATWYSGSGSVTVMQIEPDETVGSLTVNLLRNESGESTRLTTDFTLTYCP